MDIASFTASDIARFWSKVEKTDTCWIWKAGRTRAGYGMTAIWRDGRSQSSGAHRVSYELVVGPIPKGAELDHTCHQTSCVNPDHLRPTTRKQNHENRSGAQRNSKSGVRGVHWHKPSRKWRATVTQSARIHFVGYFNDLAIAEAAVIAKRNELFTHNELDRRVA